MGGVGCMVLLLIEEGLGARSKNTAGHKQITFEIRGLQENIYEIGMSLFISENGYYLSYCTNI